MYEKIEITFKNGESVIYGKGDWDDYAFDGKAVTVKKDGAWVGIYNFDNVAYNSISGTVQYMNRDYGFGIHFCVELK